MANKTIRVKGIEGCAGEWGALGHDEVKFLDAGIAQSLIRAGLAVEVDAEGAPVGKSKKMGAPKESTLADAS